jgi:hypothetical protein
MTGSHRSTIAGVLVCVTLLTAGCGGTGGDRAGGTGRPRLSTCIPSRLQIDRQRDS